MVEEQAGVSHGEPCWWRDSGALLTQVRFSTVFSVAFCCFVGSGGDTDRARLLTSLV